MRRILRGPWIWAIVALIGVLLALQYLVPNGGYNEVPTSTMVQKIQDGSVKQITFVGGGDQQIEATLDNGFEEFDVVAAAPAALAEGTRFRAERVA